MQNELDLLRRPFTMSEECRNSGLQEMDLKTRVNVIVELMK